MKTATLNARPKVPHDYLDEWSDAIVAVAPWSISAAVPLLVAMVTTTAWLTVPAFIAGVVLTVVAAVRATIAHDYGVEGVFSPRARTVGFAAGAALLTSWVVVGIVLLTTLITDAIPYVATQVVTWDPVQLFVHPVQAWISTHAEGLAMSGSELGLCWGVSAAVLYVASGFGARGAWIGWTLIGAGTSGMAWSGAPEAAQRPVALGAAALAWALLSIPLFPRPTLTVERLIPAEFAQDSSRVTVEQDT